jgi:hypothetical protein
MERIRSSSEGDREQAFRAGVLAATLLLLGLFAIGLVVDDYALAREAFLRGDLLGSAPYFFLLVQVVYVLTIRSPRVLRYAISGLWLSAGALVVYVGVRLLNGRIDAVEGYGQLAGVVAVALILTTLKLRSVGRTRAVKTA